MSLSRPTNSEPESLQNISAAEVPNSDEILVKNESQQYIAHDELLRDIEELMFDADFQHQSTMFFAANAQFYLDTAAPRRRSAIYEEYCATLGPAVERALEAHGNDSSGETKGRRIRAIYSRLRAAGFDSALEAVELIASFVDESAFEELCRAHEAAAATALDDAATGAPDAAQQGGILLALDFRRGDA